MKWNSQLELGIESIDKQHRDIIERIERLGYALDNAYDSVSLPRLQEAHEFLRTYVAEHFRNEEEKMAQGHYPDLEAHQILHREFEETIRQFREDIDKTALVTRAASELVNYLSTWFIHHIQTEDPKYLPYLKGD